MFFYNVSRWDKNVKFKVVFLVVELKLLSDWSCQVGYSKC